ncbi:TniQ family protein [Paraburkholderia metrosideri]|uniref:TniQ domain-containing protein n=1 Tax=Paraburkholderia metrosideri TaxID=580937 RepID=A0ABM8NC28_9BURK|nr:TniQ family protein [Paraburkholderia metrosideri]CAD6516534.1 hypothetical protein LMG28140_00798 [Paraburkholderia metrosideri]
MAIALFPLLDGETIGSNIGRYAEFTGAGTTLLLRRRLFGYPCKPETRLPSGINHLSDQARDYWNLDAKEIVRRSTEFYYATACVLEKQRDSMFANMLTLPVSRCLRRSVSGWNGERVAKFRYCEECLMQWRESGIPPHWLVDHQLPGVYMCPIHLCLLKLAKRSFPQNVTDPTVTALKQEDDEEIVAGTQSCVREAIGDVAKLSARYRMAEGSFLSPAKYRELLQAAGLMWPTGGVDVRAFRTCVLEHFGPEYCQLGGLSPLKLSTWLCNFLDQRRSGEPSHPFLLISTESLLNRRCMAPGSFVPAIHAQNVHINSVSPEDMADFSCQGKIAQLCRGIIHRTNDSWTKCAGNHQEWKLVCSCGVIYKASEPLGDAESTRIVESYGARYQNLISMRFADNFGLVNFSGGFPSINPKFLRWAHFIGFYAYEGIHPDMVQSMRDRWRSIVEKARPDKRITSSYRLDPKLYRTLYRYDRNWIREFNKSNRTRPSRVLHRVEVDTH